LLKIRPATSPVSSRVTLASNVPSSRMADPVNSVRTGGESRLSTFTFSEEMLQLPPLWDQRPERLLVNGS
jgi:hypothetical protein